MAKKPARQVRREIFKPLDAYNIAFQTRNLEINLFWQRSNYFLVLNTAIVTGIALKLGSSDPLVAIFIAFGIFVSCLWYRVNLGSKFWQSRWEQKLSDIERDLSPSANLFSATLEQIQAEVRASMDSAGTDGWWRRFVNKSALAKPSVSRHMIVLSIGFACLYLALLIVWLVRIVSGRAA